MKRLSIALGVVSLIFVAPGLFMLLAVLFGATFTDPQTGAAFALGMGGIVTGGGAIVAAMEGGYR